MRPLSSHFSHEALPTVETLLRHAKAARVLRRAPAVREVVAGPTITAVSTTCHCPNSALRQGLQRFARAGPGGL